MKRYFPHAMIEAGRFHVIRLVGQDLMDVRKQLVPVGSKRRGRVSQMRRKPDRLAAGPRIWRRLRWLARSSGDRRERHGDVSSLVREPRPLRDIGRTFERPVLVMRKAVGIRRPIRGANVRCELDIVERV